MGTTVSRHLRDLSELAGCEAVEDFTPTPLTPTTVGPTSSSRPCTPAPTHTSRVLYRDPRSPTAEIVRTPIEHVPSPFTEGIQESPMTSVLTSRRSYLETDLDSLSTQEHAVKPSTEVCVTPKSDMVLPAGLTHAHLLKLRFLGIDPRSPSSEIIRTPIQVKCPPESGQKAITTYNQDDTLSIGSVSSQDIGNLSINNCSSLCDFSRDCSDPSAYISEIEEIEVEESLDHEEPDVSKPAKDEDEFHDTLETECVEGQDIEPSLALVDSKCKAAPGKLAVFCEDDLDSSLIHEKNTVPLTPDTTSVTKRSRTPLTPLCNHNMTPNKIIRAKQSQSIQKENIVKVKIYNNDDNAKTPSKQALSTRQSHSVKSTGIRNSPVKSGRKVNGLGSENSEPRRRSVAQWDHDTTIII